MRVLVINLARSPARLAEFTREAGRVGIDFERLEAVDGKAMSPAELRQRVDPAFRFQPPAPGEVANFLSHRDAWARAAAHDGIWTAIFEDDVRLADDTRAILSAIEAMDPDAGIIRLETTLRRVLIDETGLPLKSGRHIHRLWSWHGGTAGYAIRRDCAASLLAETAHVSDPTDQLLFNPLSPLFAKLRNHQIVPGAAVQAARLDLDGAGAAGVTTVGRSVGGRGGIPFFSRHGLMIDLRRLLSKVRGRLRRMRDQTIPGRAYVFVDFWRG